MAVRTTACDAHRASNSFEMRDHPLALRSEWRHRESPAHSITAMTNVAKREQAPKRWGYLLAALLHISPIAWAQHAAPRSAAAVSLASSTTARFDDPWFAERNPATLAHIAYPLLASTFSPAPSAVPGLFEGEALATYPIDSIRHVGLLLEGAGIAGYREFGGRLLGSTMIAAGIGIGAAAGLRALSIDRYGSADAMDLHVGLLARLTPELSVGGAIAQTLTRGTDLERIDGMSFGAALEVAPRVTISVDVAQRLRRSATLALGLSAMVAKDLVLRCGLASAPGEACGGFAYTHDAISVAYAAAYRIPLGLQHACDVRVRW